MGQIKEDTIIREAEFNSGKNLKLTMEAPNGGPSRI